MNDPLHEAIKTILEDKTSDALVLAGSELQNNAPFRKAVEKIINSVTGKVSSFQYTPSRTGGEFGIEFNNKVQVYVIKNKTYADQITVQLISDRKANANTPSQTTASWKEFNKIASAKSIKSAIAAINELL